MQDISLKLALETVSDDLFFTLVRLGTHPDTQALSPDLSKLLAQVDATAAAHTGLLRGMTKANALAIGARADVEAFAGDLSVTALQAMVGQPTSRHKHLVCHGWRVDHALRGRCTPWLEFRPRATSPL